MPEKLEVKAKQLTKREFWEEVMDKIYWSDDWTLTVKSKAAKSVKLYTPDSETAGGLIALYENPTLMVDAIERMEGGAIEINVIE